MAMFTYNPHPDPSQKKRKKDRNTGDAHGWHAEIDESQGKLVVTYQKTDEETGKKTEEKYIVDGFENKADCKFYKEGSDKEIDIFNDEPGLWYSFDWEKHKYNFHIVPDKSIEIKIECESEKGIEKILLAKKLNCICKKLVEQEKVKVPKDLSPKYGSQPWTVNHRYVYVDIEKNEYLLSFNRLWCAVKADGNHICNSFGQAQFMCYPIDDKDDKQINCISRKFKLMYPRSDEDGKYNSEARHLVYNAPYDIKDCAEAIAKGFAEFIKRCEDGTFIESCENGEFRKLCEDSKRCEEK